MDMLNIEITEVPTPLLAEENSNDFINKQIISRMFDTIDGADFEKHLLLAQKHKTPYIKVKTSGKNADRLKTEEYTKRISLAFDQQTLQKFLYICSFCSYIGGPGFPDLVVLGHEPGLFFTTQELLPENVVFALLANLLGIGPVKIIRAVPEGKTRGTGTLKIPVKGFLNGLIKGRRFLHYLGELEQLIEKEKLKMNSLEDEEKIRQSRDEIAYLERQKQKMPFLILQKWAVSAVRREDLDEHIGEMDRALRLERMEKERLLKQLADDETFKAFGKGLDEQTVNKKKNYLMETFHIGPSRADELLKEEAWG